MSMMEEIMINRLSKIVQEIRTLSEQARSLCNTLSDDNLETANVVKSKLTSMLSRFTAELYNYFNICKNPDPDEISEFTTYQLQGEEVMAELDAKLKFRVQAPSILNKEDEPSSYCKLPDLKLPEFNGDLLEWHQFWDQFTSNISRRKLNDVDKLLYLKSSLKGDAARLIDGFDTTNRSYQIAVDTLKSRYGKDTEIIYAHHKALSKVKRAERIEDCRRTLDEISRHLRVLKSLKENTDTNQLQYLVMEKFPTEIIYEIKMRLASTGTSSVEEILNQLLIVISTKEEASRITQDISQNEATSYTVETLHTTVAGPRYKGNDTKIGNISSNTRGKGRWNYIKPRSAVWSQHKEKFRRPMKRKLDVKEERIVRSDAKKPRTENTREGCIFCKGNHNNANCDQVKTLSERRRRLRGICFSCLKPGHRAYRCPRKTKCQVCGKEGLHHKDLCPDMYPGEIKQPTATSVMCALEKGSTILQTAIANVKGSTMTRACRILFDCGSQRSYLSQDIARELDLRSEEINDLAIFTFGSRKPYELKSPLVKLELLTQDNVIETLYANVVPSISQGVPCPDKRLIDWSRRENYNLADDGSLSDRIDILLGNDYYYNVMCTKKICIGSDLYLIESKFGWILSGRMPDIRSEQLSIVTYFQSSGEVRLNEPDPPLEDINMNLLWDLESIGITDSPKTTFEEEAVDHFNKTVKYSEGRYQIKWPWIQYPPELPTNYGLAFGRLKSLLRRSDEETIKNYYEILKNQLEAGVIETVEPVYCNRVSHPVHYLPHHMVKQKGKGGRIVYDASAKIKNEKSLNECLYRGPPMIEDLTGLIIGFRSKKIAITADVEKAFLQVGLQSEDRDVTRFLWIRDPEKEITEDNVIHYRFCRVPFGIISSPFMLNATIKHHLSKSNIENIRKLAQHIYVDNLVTGTDNIEEALELYNHSKEAFKQISMNLRDWNSNSEEFRQKVVDISTDKVVKILGLEWRLEEDTLHLRTSFACGANTKRGILKSIASIYDPCGYAAPILLPAKLLLQDLWKMKMKWDTTLPCDTVEKWEEIKGSLVDIKEIDLTRYYLKNSRGSEGEIHCFTDSSTRAYAAVVYVVGGNDISFVIGKSRLVPIKDQVHLKIPRLELLGVLIGSRLVQYVLKHIDLNITRKTLWTDSQIVLDWINSTKLLTPFVSRRIEEIRRDKNLTFKYVPSELNPADAATRPNCSKEDRIRWLNGPDFLLQEQNSWPMRKSFESTLFVGEALSKTEQPQQRSLEKMEVQATEREVFCRNKEINDNPQDNTLIQIKRIQAEYFKDEVEGKTTSLSRNLGLFKDIDDILRCKGRFKHADWSFDQRYPILLPKECDFTNNVIRNTHEKNYHVGANHTLSLIRQHYWIPQGKRQVTKIIRKCFQCMKHGGGPFRLPPTPALPSERVNYSKPFTFTGVDYLGPALVKVDTRTCKRWICLFTCLAVRAIHLEVVEDLSAEEGLLALRRFIATRGVPNLITSDNALHFKLISEIVAKPYCVENNIRWKFIPELAPWHGGFYERLVGLVKHCMRRTLQKHLLKDNQLLTILKEIEAVLNTRPLTSVDQDMEHILCPADFLQPGRCLTLDTTDKEIPLQGTSTKTKLILGWKRARVIIDEFQEMFRNRYLSSLRERYHHSHKQPRVVSKIAPQEGQIVQIKGDKNREGWKVGKIVSLIKSSDGLVRVAQVKVGTNIYTRSIAQLYPLELEEDVRCEPIPDGTQEEERESSCRVPSEVARCSVSDPEIVTMDMDDVQGETLDYDKRTVVDAVNLDTATDVDAVNLDTVTEVAHNETDMVEARDLTDQTEISGNDSEEVDNEAEGRTKRVAAVRALDKIREWTRNLMAVLN